MALYRGKTENDEKVIEYEGRVLFTRERNRWDDSDFEALVAEEDGTFRWIEYATTRFWTYDHFATPDASPELVARYEAQQAAKRKALRARQEDVEGHMPAKGRECIVMKAFKHKGVKYDVGTIGTIFWVGRDHYKRDYSQPELRKAYGVTSIDLDCRTPYLRVGVNTAQGSFFTTADKIDVIMDLDTP